MPPFVEKDFWVYIVASKPRGVLYTGMTSDLVGRAEEHRERLIDGFTSKYWVGRLVWYERHAEPEAAQRREKAIKRWRRDWKIEMIEAANPTWRDLFEDVLREQGFVR
jgi:putative endonuclease